MPLDRRRIHVPNQRPARGEQRSLQTGPEELDRRDQHQGRENATRESNPADPRPDDVTDAEQLGADLHRDRGPKESMGDAAFLDRIDRRPAQLGTHDFAPESKAEVAELVEQTPSEPDDHGASVAAALIARDQYVGTGGAFR